MIIVSSRLTRTFASLILAVLAAGVDARADITITIDQVGLNVVATESGEIATGALTPVSNIGNVPAIAGFSAVAVLGPAVESSNDSWYSGISGPSSFGTTNGNVTNASSGTGETVGINGSAGVVFLPPGYISGTQTSASATFDNTNFTTLGLVAGTYTYTWGTGGPDQTLTVQIGPAAAVPEPSTAIVAVFGAVGFVTYGWSRHRRHQRRQISA
jgi:hypothetical protein